MAGPLNVLICAPIMGRDLSPLRALEPEVRIIDGNDAFEAFNRARQAGDSPGLAAARQQLDRLLAEAEVVCMSFPMAAEVAAKAPRLKWLHHTQAGVSNLWSTDLWAAPDVILTSGRGHVRPTAMAEYVVAGALSFARGLHDGFLDKLGGRLDRSHYRPLRVAGATLTVVGLGGIGSEVARLSRALGMRVVAVRRSVGAPQTGVDDVDLLLPASSLREAVREADFIAVCTQLTRETHHLLNGDVFAAIQGSAVVINISRGEVIDEEALLQAIAQGRVRGALLDVYEGELDGRPPRQELMQSPAVVLTPHVSAAGEVSGSAFMDLFVDNLKRYLAAQPLLNVVDRERGY